MKLTVDRQEKKGTFGGTYYESYIRVSLEPKEEEVARKQRIMKTMLVGTNNPDSPEFGEMIRLCGKTSISMEDLKVGITLKVDNGSQLGKLARLEDKIRTSCKDFKSNISADMMFAPEGNRLEEEI